MLTLKALRYNYEDLNPNIDEETMILHHSKHLQAYIDKANALLIESGIETEETDLIRLYQKVLDSDTDQKQALLNQLGQVYNHNLYFENLVPANAYQAPSGELKVLIEKYFGSINSLEQRLQEEAMKIFGSGWQWLVQNKASNTLELLATSNAGLPDTTIYKHLLVIDVWEHAYYLKYQNRRAEYLSSIPSIIDWNIVSDRFSQ